MYYNCFLIRPQDYEKYSEISDIFPADPEDNSIIVGADNGEDGIILALIVCSPSITDRSIAHISYVWRRRQDIDEVIFKEIFLEAQKELGIRKIKRLCLRVINVEGRSYSLMNPELLEEIGCTKEKKHGETLGYYLADFYDTAFMRSQVVKASQDEHLVSFSLCTEKECLKYLKELQKENPDVDLSFMSRVPFSYFYIDKGKPVGALSLEHYGRGSCILDGAIIRKCPAEGKVFRALLAGVLSGALDGEGMQMRLYVRMDDKEYINVIEENFGERSFWPEMTDYVYRVS